VFICEAIDEAVVTTSGDSKYSFS